MSTFADMNLPQSLAQRLIQAGLTTPTPVQEAAIPLALKGQDIMAQAKTGAKNTGGFAADYRAGHATGGLCARAWPYTSPDQATLPDRSFWCWRPRGNWRSRSKQSCAKYARYP